MLKRSHKSLSNAKKLLNYSRAARVGQPTPRQTDTRHSLDRFYGAVFSIAPSPRLRPPRISILPARGAYSRKWRELVALENIAAELVLP
jgi:hypothetical protein